jgi:hypothetical protein
MTTLANSAAEMLVRFGFFHGRSDGFGALLVGIVLFAVVIWVLTRSNSRNVM